MKFYITKKYKFVKRIFYIRSLVNFQFFSNFQLIIISFIVKIKVLDIFIRYQYVYVIYYF